MQPLDYTFLSFQLIFKVPCHVRREYIGWVVYMSLPFIMQRFAFSDFGTEIYVQLPLGSV